MPPNVFNDFRCGYQSVSLNTNDKFITDYGTKTVIAARRNGSFVEFSSEHFSCETVRHSRVNSAEKDILGEDVSAIWQDCDYLRDTMV